MPGCGDILADTIAKRGAISFRDFMEIALYDPREGYYARRAAIGDGGDFTTAPTISPLFARAVARVFARDAARIEGPIVFLEAAAGEGVFLADFRRALFELEPAVSRRTRIWALERSARGREAIAKTGAAERILADASQLAEGSITGWIFSNELYDALPVHRVQMREGKLVELGVGPNPERRSETAGANRPAQTSREGCAGGVGRDPLLPLVGESVIEGAALSERKSRASPATGPARPSRDPGLRLAWTSWAAPPELSDYLSRFGVSLAEGQIAEINLEARPLHRAFCRSIRKGRVVAFDYGHRAPILYHPHARPRGTLAVHSRGRRGGDPLERPGLVDLTAHVNWDDLIAAGEAEGFASEEIRRLSRFLIESGLFEDAARDKLSALRLLDPEGLGETLSVLVQSKNVAAREARFPGLRPGA